MIESVLAGIGVGVLGEIGAHLRRLWVYRRPLYPVLNVLLMFGLIMGTLAWAGGSLGAPALFGIGFGIGLAYEVLNFAVLDWWFFPDDRLLGLQGKTACAIGVSLGWGTVPVTVTWLTRLLR
jgi:hypothetical protein